MALEILRKIGLTEGEIKVYSAILEIGISTINKIHEKTGIERRNIYDILNKLIEKGLVSYTIEKGKRTYQITHPNKIIGYIEERKHELDKTKEEIEKEIPLIIKKFESTKPEIRAEVYRGKDGIKAIFEDMLSCRENWFIGGNGGVQKYMPFFWENWNRRRIKKKVFWHDLIDKGTLMSAFKSLAKAKEKLKELQFYEYKILPEELVSPHVIFIYGDKIANVLWSEAPFAFVIQNKEIADSYKKYFSFLWKIIK
jgi:sugar-specific transcriptional regulator TrmB